MQNVSYDSTNAFAQVIHTNYTEMMNEFGRLVKIVIEFVRYRHLGKIRNDRKRAAILNIEKIADEILHVYRLHDVEAFKSYFTSPLMECHRNSELDSRKGKNLQARMMLVCGAHVARLSDLQKRLKEMMDDLVGLRGPVFKEELPNIFIELKAAFVKIILNDDIEQIFPMVWRKASSVLDKLLHDSFTQNLDIFKIAVRRIIFHSRLSPREKKSSLMTLRNLKNEFDQIRSHAQISNEEVSETVHLIIDSPQKLRTNDVTNPYIADLIDIAAFDFQGSYNKKAQFIFSNSKRIFDAIVLAGDLM